MTREDALTKGQRYAVEGRLRVLLVHRGRIFARCHGSDRDYECGFTRGRWYCNCEARSRCAHLVALQLVTTIPTGEQP